MKNLSFFTTCFISQGEQISPFVRLPFARLWMVSIRFDISQWLLPMTAIAGAFVAVLVKHLSVCLALSVYEMLVVAFLSEIEADVDTYWCF